MGILYRRKKRDLGYGQLRGTKALLDEKYYIEG